MVRLHGLQPILIVEPTAKTLPPANAGGSNPVATASQSNAPVVGSAAAPAAPAPRPADFGGNASGRKLDGFKFPVDSAEGKEERRLADAERKKAARAVGRKLVEPAALPSAAPSGMDPGSTQNSGVAVGAGSPMPAAAPAPNFVPWDAATLQELTDEIVEGCEEGRCLKFRKLALEYKLPDKLCDKIGDTGRYKPAVKRSLKKTAPLAAANTLNRLLPGTGRFSAEGVFLLAMVANVVHGRRALAETRRIIQEEIAREKKSRPPAPLPEGLNLAVIK